MTQQLPAKVTHYGPIKIGDISFDGVVLEGGARGYVQAQLTQAIGFRKKNPSTQFRRFLADEAPKALSLLEKSGYEVVRMPHGGQAKFAPAGILTEIASGVMEAFANGTLHPQRQHIVKPSLAILRALAKTGEVALIDEATGYQYHRAPDALQDLISKLILESYAPWERRFHGGYYQALFSLFGWDYDPSAGKPHIIGNITRRWVYEIIFPPEILNAIDSRKGRNKMHQFLTQENGIPMLEKQMDAVQTIAESATDRVDFETRCMKVFNRPGQLGLVFPLQAA